MSKKPSSPSLKESDLESKVASLFDSECLKNGWLKVRIDTKGILTPNGFGKNDQEGAPDRIICVPFHDGMALFVAVELKRPKGGVFSPKQVLWKKRILNHGGRWYGIHTIEAIQNFTADIKSIQNKLRGVLDGNKQTRAITGSL